MMKYLRKTVKKIINRLSKGINVGRYKVTLTVSKTKKADTDLYGLENNICLYDVAYYEKHFPFLSELAIPHCESEAPLLVKAYHKIIPLYNDEAKEPYLRTVLTELSQASNNIKVKEACEVRIASSLVKLGWVLHPLVYKYKDHIKVKSKFLSKKKELDNIRKKLCMPLEKWPYKRSRGASLALYFEKHLRLIKGKKILHIAPEPYLRNWFDKLKSENIFSSYLTLDAGMPNVDFKEDIRNLSFDDESYDLIICHHVLEHIIDDGAVFRELYRVLSNKGLLNFTVPCSLHHSISHDWFIPDETITNHVRHYGMSDVVRRIEDAGFKVSVDEWLMSLEKKDLQVREAYPFPIYNCSKDI